MKKKLLTVALSITTLTIVAQDNLIDKGYLAVSFGSSTPIGDFASTNRNNSSSGYAKSGLLFDLSFGYKFSKYFGMATLLRGQVNKVDAQTLSNQAFQDIPDATSITVNTTGWTIGGYMAGGYGSFPISEKMSIESKVLFGFLTGTSPEIKYEISSPVTGDFWVKQSSASSVSFSYLIGIGYRFNLGKHFCFIANLDYLGANPQFNTIVTTSFGDRDKEIMNQKFGTINYNFGIGYRFARKS